MKQLAIGVIGSGRRGGLARHTHKEEEGTRVMACCDLSPATLEKNRETYGQDIFTTRDYRDL